MCVLVVVVVVLGRTVEVTGVGVRSVKLSSGGDLSGCRCRGWFVL